MQQLVNTSVSPDPINCPRVIIWPAGRCSVYPSVIPICKAACIVAGIVIKVMQDLIARSIGSYFVNHPEAGIATVNGSAIKPSIDFDYFSQGISACRILIE